MNETMTIAYNATGSGLIGITNLASQTGTIGIIIGSAFLLSVLVGVLASMHSWNTKGVLYRFIKWLIETAGTNACYGFGTVATITTIFYLGSAFSNLTESNPRFLQDFTWLVFIIIGSFSALSLIGWATKPLWLELEAYANGTKAASQGKKRVKM